MISLDINQNSAILDWNIKITVHQHYAQDLMA